MRVCSAFLLRIGNPLLGLLLAAGSVQAQPPSLSLLGHEVADDFRYLVDNVQLDAVDIARAPLHAAEPDSVLRSPKFYLAVAGVGALWAGSFALDQTLRSRLHNMSSSDADLLQNVSYASIGGGSALLYGYGLYADEPRAREYALTAGEGAGIATLLDLGIKAAFGRLRPFQDDHSHTAFFRGGESFVSGDVTPVFALAAGISEYFDNTWYVAGPAYALALTDGFGRMGHDAHWFSDVVGAALLGWGTTELFLYLHERHAAEPSRWRLLPLSGTAPGVASQALAPPVGISLNYGW